MDLHFQPQRGETAKPGTQNGKQASGLRPIDIRAVLKTQTLLEGIEKMPNVEIVEKVDVKKYALGCRNEHGTLKTVVISLPTYLDWDVPINEKEASGIKPDRCKAVEQHAQFINTLVNFGINVVVLKPAKERLEGVYTRDIGMVIGSKFIHGNLVAEPRWPEMETVTGGIVAPKEVQLEGGNVIIEGEHVFVGVGRRGNMEGVEWLQHELGTSYKVKPIALRQEILHLDCVFSPVQPQNGRKSGALVYAPAFKSDRDLTFFEKVYGQLHYLKDHEYPALAANIVWLDESTIIANPNCKIAYGVLTKMFGLTAIPIDMSEIVKADGGPRCSTLPLLRE